MSEIEIKAPTAFTIAGARAVAEREEKGVDVNIRDETGEMMLTTDESGALVQATATVLGKFSATYRKADQAVSDTMLRKRATDLTAELLENNELSKIAACVSGWNLRDGVKPIPCDKFNIITVLKAAPWIRRDLEAVMGDPGRFLA